jgi:hypothetical protein
MEGEAPAGIDYPALVGAALRSVLKDVLARVAEAGFPGEHHLFISFRTDAPGVSVPPRLLKQHPQEMTIVLQHQFWGLTVEEGAFSVQLRFGGVLERLTVPWDALVAFADPSVPFGLRFTPPSEPGAPPEAEGEAAPAAPAAGPTTEAGPADEAKVVAFRPARKAGPRG